jgi:hypothetical protein|tara:strand:+ start:66 stop:455 length:390 start_codon:yes stop_codon:yes gene_type:complete
MLTIIAKNTLTIIAYILSLISGWLCAVIITRYLEDYIKKKIKVEINHAGNQEIPEFYDNDGNKKCITFEIDEDATIAEVKDEISKRVKYTDRTISLFKKPFGKKLLNTTNIITFHNTDPLYLYIVIPNY